MGKVTDSTIAPIPDDAALVAQARGGDREALEALLARHQGVVFRFLVGILGDEEAAADVAQDALVKAVRNLAGFRGDAGFRTWLIAIARNEARGALRKNRRSRETGFDEGWEPADDARTPDETMEGEGEMDRVRSALGRLPEKQRMTVSLRLFDGLSFREIGDATDSSEGAARVNYHHGIRKLRDWLEPEG